MEEDAPVQPVQAKAIERVRKVEGDGGHKVGSVGEEWRGMGGSGGKTGGGKSGGTRGGGGDAPPKKAEKQPNATPPVEQSNALPQEKKKVPAPLGERERKPKPKVKEPDLKEVVTPAQRELVAELQKMQRHDPDVVPTQGGGYGRIVSNRASQPVGARVHRNKC